MSHLGFLLLCSLAGSVHCLEEQRSQPRQAQLQENQEHLWLHSRKYCNPSYNNHTGGNIKDCGPGEYRIRQGLYRRQCVPCKCNGLSNECDKNTGKCLNCQLNTAGDHCERCAEGHYGSAALRTCRLCPCPLSHPSHSFAIGCLHVGGHIECLCKAGYSGTRCERCAIGYYGDPLADGGSCRLCDCNPGYICDPITGNCQFPDEPNTDDDCQECDSCFQTLMDDLETMDDELSNLNHQLKFQRNISIIFIALRKLEEGIIATKEKLENYNESVRVLKQEVTELEADINGVRNDMMTLNIKADQTFLTSKDLLKDLSKTQQNSKNLLTDIEELMKRVQDFLEQLRISHDINITGMLEEAQRMVNLMGKQNCKVQMMQAENELWEAQQLLDYIMNTPLDSNQATAERITQDLISWNMGLKELKKALKRAEKTVNRSILMNVGNEDILSNIMNHHMMIENKKDDILSDLTRIRGTLRDTEDLQNMMNNLKNDYAKLAAELDGAMPLLKQKLDELSKALAMEVIVRKAEEHAQELMDLAMHFHMSLLNFTNTSAVHKVTDRIIAFGDIINAIKEAEAAANKANKTADHAIAEMRDVPKKAEGLKHASYSLDDKAKKAENILKDVTEKYNTTEERLDKAKDKTQNMLKDIQTLEDELHKINQDHIGALLKQAKDAVKAANKTVNSDTARLRNVSEELDNIKIPSGETDVDNILNSINETLEEVNKLFPNLTDALAEVENHSSQLPSRTNISDSIINIKEMIAKTRGLANTIGGPILFSGESHVELRPPKNLVDLRAFTAMDLMLRQPKIEPPGGVGRRSQRQSEGEENQFVLYLGNKNMKKDFIGMVVMDGVLYCVYKLGGITYKIKTERITQSSIISSFMDRVDFRRMYQDAEVIFTQHYRSTKPIQLPKMTNQPNTTVTLLDLGSDEIVFYVGGYPHDFTPPPELQYPKFKGCIQFFTLNEHILSLYNFQRAVNIKKTDQCFRGDTQEVARYFDGTGYGKIDVISSRSVRFFVLSRQENALLFFMGNEDSYFTITVEKGYVVLRSTENNQTQIQRSEGKVFPVAFFKNIKILQATQTDMKVSDFSVNIKINYRIYKQAFIGGIPAAIAERLNIYHPALRGCLKELEVDVTINFAEAIGIQPGCPLTLLGVNEVSMEMGSSLTLPANSSLPNSATMVSLGFRSTQSSGVLLQSGDTESGFEVSLVDGHIEMKDSTTNVKSKNRYDEGSWHYLTAFRNSTGIELSVDNSDQGHVKTMSTGSTVPDTDVILGKQTFNGCLRNLYMRRMENRFIPTDLSNFTQTGVVLIGVCNAQPQPLSIMARQRGHIKSKFKKKDCNEPVSHILAYHLSAHSQLQYTISREDLNYRPHIFLDMRTRSANGLLLHITDKHGFARVILFMSGGRVKLFVGDGTLIHYQKKINDGAWHNIRFSVEQHVIHMVVDGFRLLDGQLQKNEGISMELQPPVYFGAGKIQLNTDTQSKFFPQKSVIGCIRYIRFNGVHIGEPDVSHGGAPCFDGFVEEGAYFAGGGSHMILEKRLMLGAEFSLTFEVRPRNMTGLLFHSRNQQGHSLSVFLKKGTMVVQMNDGAGDYSTSVTPPLLLCVETFHHVTVTKKGNIIKLTMGHISNSAIGPYVYSPSKNHHKIYIGGVPERKKRRVPVWSSYIGCLRNVQINQAALSFKSVSNVFGAINVNECPAE